MDEDAKNTLALREAVLAQCKTEKLLAGWNLESLEVDDGTVKAVWYFPPGGFARRRGLEILNDSRFPNSVTVTLNGMEVTMLMKHWRSKRH